MKPLPTIPWPRIFAEGAIIVVSILLAFAIDAWWNARGDRQNEETYLVNLRTVLIDQKVNIDQGLQFARELQGAARKILNAAVDAEASITDAELDKSIERLTWPIVSPISPELKWLLSENRIGLVSDPTLVNELGKLRLNLVEFERTHSSAANIYYDHMIPYLRRHASLPQINNISAQEPGTSDNWPTNHLNVTSKISHQALLQDQEFVNLMMDYDWRLTNILRWRTSVVESDDVSGVERILGLLEE